MSGNPLNFIEKLIKKVDTFQRRHPTVAFLQAVMKKYREDEAGHQAALLAYYGFLSLFPLLLVLTTVLRIGLHSDTELSARIIHGATTYFPIIGNDLQDSVHGLGKTGLTLVVGILITLFGARGVADIFRSGVNHVWEVPYVKRSGFPGSLLRSFSIIFVGGFGLLAAPVISSYALAFGHGFTFRLLALALTLAMLFSVFVFAIKMAQSIPRPFRDIWPGAAVAAVGLMILQALGGVILTREMKNLDNLYGTFAIVLGLLFWIYLQTQLLLYSLEIDAVRTYHLWPRSLTSKRLMAADKEAYRLYEQRNQFHSAEQLAAIGVPPQNDVTNKE